MLVRVENSVPYTVNFMKGGSAISWILAISLSTILELARKGGSMEPMEPYLDPPLELVVYGTPTTISQLYQVHTFICT